MNLMEGRLTAVEILVVKAVEARKGREVIGVQAALRHPRFPN